MKLPSHRTIRRRLKELRTLIETNKDPAITRIAYGMECAIIWATDYTVGWEPPAVIAKDLAVILRRELADGREWPGEKP